jgi:hypothetical protein
VRKFSRGVFVLKSEHDDIEAAREAERGIPLSRVLTQISNQKGAFGVYYRYY